MNLDDTGGIAEIDKQGMLEAMEKFPEQIEEAVRIGANAPLHFEFNRKNVVIAGMGGSAMGGEILSSLFKYESKVPIFINRGYELPAFINEKSLFIAMSYSGNTEETISCFNQAVKRRCKIISISSGGELEKLSGKADCHIKIPSGMQPRAALAYLLFPAMAILERLGLVEKCNIRNVVKTSTKLREKIKIDVSVKNNHAKQIALKMNGITLIYGHDFLAPVAKRWHQQLNENAKTMAFDFSLPEANHNELMAWEGKEKNNVTCIFLRCKKEDVQVKKRFEFMKEIYQEKADVIEIFAEGEDNLSQLVYAIYLGDYVSNYLAVLRNIDPTPVTLIQELKKRMKEESP